MIRLGILILRVTTVNENIDKGSCMFSIFLFQGKTGLDIT